MNTVLTRVRETALPVAFAASLAIHVSTFAVLLGLDGAPRATRMPVPERTPTLLLARLVAPAANVEPTPAPLPVLAPAIPAFDPPAAPPEIPPGISLAKPPRGAATGEQSPLGWQPRIVINNQVPRARFGETFDGDVLAGFPTEVDAAVVVPDKVEIPFPPAALAARREGTVLVWAVIDAHGAVEATHVVEGDPEFAEAVEAALARTLFIPAHDLGQTLRYYVTLEFEFRFEATGATVGAGSATTAPR